MIFLRLKSFEQIELLAFLANKGHVALVQPQRAILLTLANKFFSSIVVRRRPGRPKLMCTNISKIMCTNITWHVCQHCVALKIGNSLYMHSCYKLLMEIDIQPFVGKRPYQAKCWQTYPPQIWGLSSCTEGRRLFSTFDNGRQAGYILDVFVAMVDPFDFNLYICALFFRSYICWCVSSSNRKLLSLENRGPLLWHVCVSSKTIIALYVYACFARLLRITLYV